MAKSVHKLTLIIETKCGDPLTPSQFLDMVAEKLKAQKESNDEVHSFREVDVCKG